MTTDPEQRDERDQTERLEAMLSDYVEGTLSLAERQELERHLAADPALREQLEETREAQKALKSLNKTPAPDDLGKTVEDIIHRRSAGRFFGRRAFGDRIPFGYLLILALALLVAVSVALCSSSTGSLRLEREDRPKPPPGAQEIVPRPRL
jgi:anti-sigma factor RsiW